MIWPNKPCKILGKDLFDPKRKNWFSAQDLTMSTPNNERHQTGIRPTAKWDSQQQEVSDGGPMVLLTTSELKPVLNQLYRVNDWYRYTYVKPGFELGESVFILVTIIKLIRLCARRQNREVTQLVYKAANIDRCRYLENRESPNFRGNSLRDICHG